MHTEISHMIELMKGFFRNRNGETTANNFINTDKKSPVLTANKSAASFKKWLV